jgi:signal transduction histidine kinase
VRRCAIDSHSRLDDARASILLTQGVQNPEQFLVSGFIDEIVAAATLEANARGIRLPALPVEDGLTIEADRQILAAVVGNVLQNAFKFARPHSTVTLRVGATTDRVLIDVEDECGGLPDGNDHALFRPFEQRSVDRTGLGLGLAFSRWGAEANHGTPMTPPLMAKPRMRPNDAPRPTPAAGVRTGVQSGTHDE